MWSKTFPFHLGPVRRGFASGGCLGGKWAKQPEKSMPGVSGDYLQESCVSDVGNH